MWQAVTDLAHRRNLPLEGTADEWWAGSAREFTHLAGAATEWWIAEHRSTGDIVGYARSVERTGLLELTEFFVEPSQQTRGLGSALLSRAFPSGRGQVRAIIATTDVRALNRYYAADTMARFPIFTLTGTPTEAPGAAMFEIVPVDSADLNHLAEIDAIERAIVGYPRGIGELRWILQGREGYLYRRSGESIGFSFVGREGAGPIGALETRDLAHLLQHVESRAHALGVDRLSLQVPGVNAAAMRQLIGHGFRIDEWVNLFMSDHAFGAFDRFIAFSPLFL